MQDFLTAFPASPTCPKAPDQDSRLVAWQHFFNTFFMVLIIARAGGCETTSIRPRSGPRDGQETAAARSASRCGSTSPRRCGSPAGSSSWRCSSRRTVDAVVPTNWDVFPNAVSAALQYVSLDWPTETAGQLQQPAGARVLRHHSSPRRSPRSRVYECRGYGRRTRRGEQGIPIEWARGALPGDALLRAVIIVRHSRVRHGRLRNLNHMYGGAGGVNWAGLDLRRLDRAHRGRGSWPPWSWSDRNDGNRQRAMSRRTGTDRAKRRRDAERCVRGLANEDRRRSGALQTPSEHPTAGRAHCRSPRPRVHRPVASPSRHLSILRDAGLVSAEQIGQRTNHRLNRNALNTIEDWLYPLLDGEAMA